MCNLAFDWRPDTATPLRVWANRDEFLARPAASTAFWPEAPQLLAGRDLSAGGSWMGVTRDGRTFRPSDWAERLSGSVARHGPGRRIIYHPSVKVVMRNGIKCVSVDRLLEEESPQLYQFILNFANENHLKIEEAR